MKASDAVHVLLIHWGVITFVGVMLIVIKTLLLSVGLGYIWRIDLSNMELEYSDMLRGLWLSVKRKQSCGFDGLFDGFEHTYTHLAK